MPTTTAPSGVSCPKCGMENMWDNRATKRNPRAPDYKCRDKECDGCQWPPKGGANTNGRQTSESQTAKQPTNVGDLPGDPATDVDFNTLCTRYAECVGYIVKKIVPALTEKDFNPSSEAVASMSACLYIERNRRNV